MAVYCSRELMLGLEGVQFPATKQQLLDYAEGRDAPEAAIVALNALPQSVLFVDLDSVCHNVGIVCSLEIYRILDGVRFPARKSEIIAYAVRRRAPRLALNALEGLNPDAVYSSTHVVCSRAGLEDDSV